MKRLLPGFILVVALSGCETVEDRREIIDAQEQVKGIIKEEMGIDSLVGFNSRNDVLIDVTIALSASDIGDRTVSELVRFARLAVKNSFESKPRAIYIRIVTTSDQ